MASTLQMAGPISPMEELALKGVHRSRLSLHLNTPHVRRWFLVQLVSMPVEGKGEEAHAGKAQPLRIEAHGHSELSNLIDDYMTAQTLRRCS